MEKTQTNDRAMHARSGCDQCKFCGVVMGIGKEVTFICRYRPPTCVGALVQTPNGMNWVGNTMWPNVAKTDWCGSWEAVLQ